MKKNFLVISLMLFSGYIAVAQATLYSPRALIIPLHTTSKQLHVSAGFATSTDHGSMDFNLSYSLTNSIAAFVSAAFNPFTFKHEGDGDFFDPSYHYNYNNFSTSFGAEYYKSGLDGFINVVEAQLGGSFSTQNRLSFAINDALYDVRKEQNYSSVFAQISAAKAFEKFDVSLALRVNHVNYGSFREYEVNGVELYENSQYPSTFFFEPAIGGSYVIKSVKLNLQVGGFVKKFESEEVGFESTTKESVLFSRLSVQYNF